MYTFLGLLEGQDLDAAQERLQLVSDAITESSVQCNELDAIMEMHAANLKSEYMTFTANLANKTEEFANTGIVDAADQEWFAVANADYSDITDLCGITIQDLKTKFEPIASRVQEKQFPTSMDIWRLMSAMETGAKRSRYFTVIFRE